MVLDTNAIRVPNENAALSERKSGAKDLSDLETGEGFSQAGRDSLDFSSSRALMMSICRRFSMLAKLVSGS